jgi:hypothetical protein
MAADKVTAQQRESKIWKIFLRAGICNVSDRIKIILASLLHFNFKLCTTNNSKNSLRWHCLMGN